MGPDHDLGKLRFSRIVALRPDQVRAFPDEIFAGRPDQARALSHEIFAWREDRARAHPNKIYAGWSDNASAFSDEILVRRSVHASAPSDDLFHGSSPGDATDHIIELREFLWEPMPMLAARWQDTALSMSADKFPGLRPCSAEEEHGVTGVCMLVCKHKVHQDLPRRTPSAARRPRRVLLNSPYHSSIGFKHTHLELCHIRIQKHDCDS